MLLPDDKTKELILKDKLVSQKDLVVAEALAKSTKAPLSQALLDKGFLTDEKLGELTASYLGVPFIILAQQTIGEDLARIIPEKVARRQKAFAFARDAKEVKVAMADPKNAKLLAFVTTKTGLKASAYYATDKDIEGTINLYKKLLQKTIDELLKEDINNVVGRPSWDEVPVAKIVEELIRSAYNDRASDIHLEPEELGSLVRFRIDGVLQDVVMMPKHLHDRFVTRIKVLSNLRTDEHLSAQDGKMHLPLEEEDLDIRVSIIPVAYGEKVVLRLLSSKSREFTLSDLGMNDEDLKKVTNAFGKSYGMVLSTGPTGSGKTTSIYAILKILNTRGKNITTIEDPIEYRIKGANQIQVNVKTNLTFANGLRSILRQDPNIIFVGEIRDSETAGIAVNAALTGHLVLSTLHTNDAATALPRLIDMQVEPFLVASTVSVIVAQRLVRKICESCKVETSIKRSEVLKNIPEEIILKHFFNQKEDLNVFQGKGCKMCHHTGYAGRIGIFEVIGVSEKIRRLITEKSNSDVISRQAISEGMTTMLDDGLDKVAKGLTTAEEVIRVTKVESI